MSKSLPLKQSQAAQIAKLTQKNKEAAREQLLKIQLMLAQRPRKS